MSTAVPGYGTWATEPVGAMWTVVGCVKSDGLFAIGTHVLFALTTLARVFVLVGVNTPLASAVDFAHHTRDLVVPTTEMGSFSFLVAHLRDDHKVDMHSGCTFNHRYVKSNPREVENATWMLTVFHCFGQYFCLHFEAFQLGMAPVYMAFLRFMGDENEARNYTYSLEVGGNGRKMVWEGTPRSIRDSHRKVRDSHDGLIIQRNMALFFSGGDRKELKLRVTGRIWKEQPNPDGTCIPNLCS